MGETILGVENISVDLKISNRKNSANLRKNSLVGYLFYHKKNYFLG